MQPEKLLGFALPVIFLLLLSIESRYAARRFETVPRWRLTGFLFFAMVRIPVNVTADSGNVTGIPANVTEGRCCAF